MPLKVIVSDEGVECRRPDGVGESVRWDDLRAVLIETTDQGPLLDDVFWILIGQTSGCVVPQGADGEDVLFERLGKLPDFDYAMVIEAMSSTDNARYLCWERDDGGQ